MSLLAITHGNYGVQTSLFDLMKGSIKYNIWIAELLIVELNKLRQVPILDGSAREWVDAIEEAGLKAALDRSGNSCEKLAPVLKEPVTVWKNDSFIVAFPYSKVKITYGIDFPQVISGSLSAMLFFVFVHIDRQWYGDFHAFN